MSDTEAARALADIIYKAPGTVALENIAEAIGNICRFMEEPCDPRLGLRPELQEKLGRIFFQMKKNEGPAFEALMKTYTFRPSMVDRINLWVSEAQYNILESGRLKK